MNVRSSSRLPWFAAYGALVLAPLAALFGGARPPGLGWWWDASLAAGFAAFAMMAVQFVLTARFKRAASPFGIDVVYYFHRYLAVAGFLLAVAHPVVLFVENPAIVEFLDPRLAPVHMTAGVVALVALAVVVGSSLLRKRIHLEYDWWRRLHIAGAVVAVAGAWWHVREVGYYTAQPLMAGLWDLGGAALVATVLYVRAWRPWRLSRRPYRVSSITVERGDAWTLALEPCGHRGFPHAPGQFVWLTLRASPWAMREHPFSVSSAPRDDGQLTVTVKALGNFTSQIGSLRVGERAFVDGPYGAFSIDRHPAPGYVFIAGGIGIAPIISCLRTMQARHDPRPVLMIYAYRRWERMTFREELEALQTELALDLVFVLEEPPADWAGARGRITSQLLARYLPPAPERGRRECFICGPTPMIDAVERALVEVGVPARRIQSEIFDLA